MNRKRLKYIKVGRKAEDRMRILCLIIILKLAKGFIFGYNIPYVQIIRKERG